MTLEGQFHALRELHALATRQGESPWVLAGLARASANLGALTEFHWSPAHKVYKARALLYAQRLLARQPREPWSYWHRAYALALTGLHRDALEDLARATQLLADAARQGPGDPRLRQAPAWVGPVEALCRFDTPRPVPPLPDGGGSDLPHAGPAGGRGGPEG
jgi:hypothetical protein